MTKSSEQVTDVSVGSDVIADDPVSRRTWKTPRVILGTMEEAEVAGTILGDGGTLS